MKAKIKDIMSFEPATTKLLNYEWKSPKTSYNVFVVVNAVLEESKFFKIEKSKLFKKYGKAEGEVVKIKPEHISEFQKSIDSLLELEVNIPNPEFTMDDVLSVNYVEQEETHTKVEKLTPMDMYRIETFLNNVKELNSPKQE